MVHFEMQLGRAVAGIVVLMLIGGLLPRLVPQGQRHLPFILAVAAGIMLGAVWANASWGRYWGWDPKETWALITLLWYVSLLHGRFAGWLRGPGLALGTIGGFFLLLMTYYGVSFYLVGLHSYAGGNAKPMPPALIAYLVGEAAFIGAVALKSVLRSRQPV
jgi:cytochrome c biogenesis factor